MVQRVEPALHEQSPLDSESSDEEAEPHAAKAVTFQEGHEETKSNKDHHMHILEAWREKPNISSDHIFLYSPLNTDSTENYSFCTPDSKTDRWTNTSFSGRVLPES